MNQMEKNERFRQVKIYATIALLFSLSIPLFPLASSAAGMPLTADIVCEDFPPFFTPSLPGDGMAGEIIREAFKENNVAVRFNYVPYARALIYFKEGKFPVHVGTSAVFSEAEKSTFISRSFIWVRWRLFTYKKPAPEFNSLAHLKSLKIGSYIGATDTALYRKAGLQPFEQKSMDALLKMLHYGRVDAVSIIDLAFYSKARELYPDESDLFKASAPIFQTDGSVMFSKKHPDGEKLARLFEKGLAGLRKNGRLRQIVERYYGGKLPPNTLY